MNKRFLIKISFAFVCCFGFLLSQAQVSHASTIVICASGDYTNCANISSDVPIVRQVPPFNNFAITSMVVPVGGSVTLYANINYQPTATCVSVGPGSYNDFEAVPGGNFVSVGSIKVDSGALPGCRVVNLPNPTPTTPGGGGPPGGGGGPGGGTGTGTGTGGLPGVDLTIDGISRIIYAFACWLWSIAMIVLVIFIILAGLRFMYAGADPGRATSAKQNFKYVILGAIVVMGTFVIISTIAYNIGVNISFIPFNCSNSGGTGGPTSGTDYQGDGFQCYASLGDCEASGDSNCSACPFSCTDGLDCAGSTGSEYQGDGLQCYASLNDCEASGDSNCIACPSGCTDGLSCGGRSGNEYQGDGFQCYDNLTDCQASGDSNCTSCPFICTDGLDCTR